MLQTRTRSSRTLASGLLQGLLALLIVLAQFGALGHEIGHLREDLAERGHAAHDHEHGKVCELCLAFGQVAAAITTPVFALPPIAARFAPAAPAVFVFVPADAPPALGRGPPALL